MKLREGISWVLTLAALAVGGAAWQHARGLDVRLAIAQAEAAQAKGMEARANAMQQELAAAKAAADLLHADLDAATAARKAAEARGEELAARLKATEASARPVDVARPAKKKGGMMAMFAKAAQDPATRKQMKQALGMQVGMMYGDLLKEWGLEGEARQAVLDLLAERMMAQGEVAMLMLDEELSPEEVVRRQDEALAKQKEALAAQMDPARQARLEAFEGEMSDRMLGQQADHRLAGVDLDPAQRERVRAVLMEEGRGVQASMQAVGMGGGPGGPRRMTVEEVRRSREAMGGGGSPLGAPSRP